MDKNYDKRLLEAVRLIRDYCDKTSCRACIFDYHGDCMFTNDCDTIRSEYVPCNWDILIN